MDSASKEALCSLCPGAEYNFVERTEVTRPLAQSAEVILGNVSPEHIAPPTHPLWTVKNVLITPHVSGAYHLQETLTRIIKISLKNFARYLNGQEPENLVDRKTGYRKRP